MTGVMGGLDEKGEQDEADAKGVMDVMGVVDVLGVLGGEDDQVGAWEGLAGPEIQAAMEFDVVLGDSAA